MKTLKKDIESILYGCECDDPYCSVVNTDSIARRINSHCRKFIEWILEKDRYPGFTINELYKQWIKSKKGQ